ncbi:MAG: hypothetical protein ACAH88_00030 [Roseimicrobium sp.]
MNGTLVLLPHLRNAIARNHLGSDPNGVQPAGPWWRSLPTGGTTTLNMRARPGDHVSAALPPGFLVL